ncbi:nuclear transport factor 2 family protein [Kribbella sp. NPDC056345]|uniref:nuclear transport factor 2 family protein n=1 Tax=Kribbella sp. NPDC056345 TaxID=3345789 RepID=UPI0035D95B6A
MTQLDDHVTAFNHAVTTGDWDTFATRFAEDARMTFVGVPAGPFTGRATIAAAYAANPPTETMTLLDPATGRFQWSGGGTGTMHVTWAPNGTVQELTVAFD